MYALQLHMHGRFLDGLELPRLGPKSEAIVKEADVRSFIGEQVIAPPGRAEALGRDEEAESLTIKYREMYRMEDYMMADGRAVLDFIVRIHTAMQKLKSGE
jgi:hypothetical protein